LARTARYFALTLTLVAALGASAQAWKGVARVNGSVVDDQGKPVKGARVHLKSVKHSNTGPQAIVTDDRGRWAALGLAGGSWNIDVEAEGFLTRQTSVELSELSRIPPMKIELEAAPPPAPKEEPAAQEVIQVGGVEVSPEIAAALEAANAFMKEQKWKEAAAEYEKAAGVLTTNMPLKFALSRAYHGAGEIDKAIAQLQAVYTADSGNMTAASLLADMLLEKGDAEEANKILAAMPPGAISDPNTVINYGIRFINLNKPDQAWKHFNNAVAMSPDLAAGYYYRAVAALQLKKMAEARADLNKVIAMDPQSAEAKDAKELLAQMK
jgi:hypothetical protein